MVAPSDMMDGRVGAIREALDAAGYRWKALPDASLSLEEGCIAPFASGNYYPQVLRAVCIHLGQRPDTPWEDLPAAKGAMHPSSRESDASGMRSEGSTSSREPRPAQSGQAPYGALKLKSLG